MSAQVTTESQVKSVKRAPSKSRKQRRLDKEIKTLQESSDLILPRTTFNRIVRDITNDSEIRYNQDAVEALQTSLEEYATKLFEGSNVLAAVADRDTVYVEDLRNFIKLNNM